MKDLENPKVTFIFGTGREEKMDNPEYSNEFFYSYDYFLKDSTNTQYIEFKNYENFINKYILRYLDKILSKIFKLGFTTNSVCKVKNFKLIYNSEYIVLVNERTAIASLPMIMLTKIFKKTSVNLIVMGLFSKKLKYNYQKFLQKILIKLIILNTDNLIFLGIGEYNESKKFTTKHEKLHYVPFSINTDFWSSSGNSKNKEGILFIGNDGNRDFKKVLSIAKKMPELKFTFLTENIQQSVSVPKNVILIKGHWNKSVLTDLEVKKLYDDSKISIIPLHDSLQPSGQSVAMQSMAMGVPVIISKTRGFWDTDNFLDGKNILLLENNSVENWVKTINEIYDNSDTLNLLALNANELVRNQYDMRKFYDKLKIILFVNNSV